jgi:hypothetical protein
MKKSFFRFSILLFAAPFFAAAVTWQMDSAPFMFGAESVRNDVHARTRADLRCSANLEKGVVIIRFEAPAKGATLNIYRFNGTLAKTIDVRPGTESVLWDVSKNVPAGTYLVSLQNSAIGKTARISITSQRTHL